MSFVLRHLSKRGCLKELTSHFLHWYKYNVELWNMLISEFFLKVDSLLPGSGPVSSFFLFWHLLQTLCCTKSFGSWTYSHHWDAGGALNRCPSLEREETQEGSLMKKQQRGNWVWTGLDLYLCRAPSHRSPPGRAVCQSRGRKWSSTWQNQLLSDLERQVRRWWNDWEFCCCICFYVDISIVVYCHYSCTFAHIFGTVPVSCKYCKVF